MVGEEVWCQLSEPECVVLSGEAIEIRIDVWNWMNESGWNSFDCSSSFEADHAPDRARDEVSAVATVKAFEFAAPQFNERFE